MPNAAASNAPYLKLEHVRKTFGQFTALKSIALAVHPGEMVTFLGPSGCGKTTLLRIIAGLETQDTGTIVQDGRDISRLPPMQRDYGIVFQSYALFPNLTIFDNVAYGLVNRRKGRDEIHRRVGELLKLVGLPESGPSTPASFPAASSNASRWRERWRHHPGCCCSTNRCRPSMRWNASGCAEKSARCNAASVSRPSWSRTTRKRRCRWRIASS